MKKMSKLRTKEYLLNLLGVISDDTIEEQIDKIIDYLDGHNCFTEAPTIESIVNYADREFRKKFGQDAIFCDFPLSATTVMKLSAFQGKNRIKDEDYKKYCYWLVHNPRIRKELGRNINIWDLCRQQLYMKFLNEAPEVEEIVTERKRISKKRLLTFEPS